MAQENLTMSFLAKSRNPEKLQMSKFFGLKVRISLYARFLLSQE
ncbi:hypothetical protein RBEAN4_1372 [Rickettsia bellii str. RML An4]|uniref:Uncharacterized protein n=1 Tax=Rickettsia bellii str. RML An4 TaxID=1359193 RepID=A0A0F3QG03_RICBE|nr:hypothetical protein RBEAN4_1372 [Rickettsia bellii str. RML An4]